MEQLLAEYREENENVLDYIFEGCQGNPIEHISEQCNPSKNIFFNSKYFKVHSFKNKFMAKVDEEMTEFGPDYDAEFELEMAKHIQNVRNNSHQNIQ
jgi:predicted house-cleaning noncanonical NTP pyrophosphatase (MazG superfamily)